MELSVIGLAIFVAAFLMQMHFRFKKIEMKLIELDMRLDSAERERTEKLQNTK